MKNYKILIDENQFQTILTAFACMQSQIGNEIERNKKRLKKNKKEKVQNLQILTLEFQNKQLAIRKKEIQMMIKDFESLI